MVTARGKKRILLFQTRSRAEAAEKERENYRVALGSRAKLGSIWSLDEILSKKSPAEVLAPYDGVIFGGSTDYDFDGGRMADDPFRLVAMIILSRTRNLISYALAEKIPLLGICFGHQMLANMHGGEVKCDPEQMKGGTHEVTLTAEGKRDKLFRNLHSRFMAQYVHKDSVTKLPKGAKLLARSANCRFSVLRYGESAYTMQFHPEKTAEVVAKNLASSPHLLPEGITDPAAVVEESPEASKIIPLWIEKVVKAPSQG